MMVSAIKSGDTKVEFQLGGKSLYKTDKAKVVDRISKLANILCEDKTDLQLSGGAALTLQGGTRPIKDLDFTTNNFSDVKRKMNDLGEKHDILFSMNTNKNNILKGRMALQGTDRKQVPFSVTERKDCNEPNVECLGTDKLVLQSVLGIALTKANLIRKEGKLETDRADLKTAVKILDGRGSLTNEQRDSLFKMAEKRDSIIDSVKNLDDRDPAKNAIYTSRAPVLNNAENV